MGLARVAQRAAGYWPATSSTTQAMFGKGQPLAGAGFGVRAPLGAGAGAGAGAGTRRRASESVWALSASAWRGVGATGAAGVLKEATGDGGLRSRHRWPDAPVVHGVVLQRRRPRGRRGAARTRHGEHRHHVREVGVGARCRTGSARAGNRPRGRAVGHRQIRRDGGRRGACRSVPAGVGTPMCDGILQDEARSRRKLASVGAVEGASCARSSAPRRPAG